jgi:hypothetical protein
MVANPAEPQPDSEPPPPGRPDLRSTGEQIETLLASLAGAGRPAQQKAEDLVRLVAELYGTGLERLLDIAFEAGALTPTLLERLAEDELVASLLIVHGLHPYDVETRARQALDGLRLELAAQGVSVELTAADQTGVRLLLTGASGCGAAALVESVAAAVEAAAPDAAAVVCEQVGAPAAQALIPVSSLSVRTRPEEAVRS